MALSDNPFLGLPLDQLQQIQQTWLQHLNSIALTGQSYSFPNRSLTRANIPEIKEILVDVRYAIETATGTTATGSKAVQIAQATIDTQSRFSGNDCS